MPRTAIEIRPSTLAAVLLTAALAVALQCRGLGTGLDCGERRTAAAVLALGPSVTRVLPPIDRGALIVPPEHADARPWPHGMVIAPPPTADPINLFVPQVSLLELVDRVLAALATAPRAPGQTAS